MPAGGFARGQQRGGVLDSIRGDMPCVVTDVVRAGAICRMVRCIGRGVCACDVVDVGVGCGDVVEVPSRVEGIEAVPDAFGNSLDPGDGDQPGGIEDGSGLLGTGAPAPVGEDVNVFGDVGDQAQSAAPRWSV